MRWLWIDRFLEFHSGQSARAVKNVSMAEEQLRDHFPAFPIMPGSLVIEGMAQTGGILVGEAKDFKDMVVLAKLSQVDFWDCALPGDRLTYDATLIELRDEGAVVEAKAFVNERPLASAQIVFGHVPRTDGPASALERYLSFKQDLLDTLGVPRREAAGVSGGSPDRSSPQTPCVP
jgi:3-hydroxyacyl-[acyl-carrier-protein] dehydratase